MIRGFCSSSRSLSHVGKNPVIIPPSTQIVHSLNELKLSVKGPLGEESVALSPFVQLKQTENDIKVSVQDTKIPMQRSMWGLTRTLVQNAVTGVTEGFRVNVRLVGVGYRAAIEGDNIHLKLGFSHPVIMQIPQGVKAETPAPNKIILSGSNKHHVTAFAAAIRHWRKPEPYNGKGIFINDETIQRKDKR
ncbi:hypothetical protein E3P99_00742 [Wallemia hederae]|uniref:Large ribosomal subunit protein uL6m n=1 Tax=Wallemia hederae TaxID=1540922 RepID=A0A4T0FU57_9BASI|nr:hypothetical protein E3P99_00742 [Wallemia hederae]